jgi:hypothetical protein
MGTPGLKYTQDIAAHGIPSPSAMGTPKLNGGSIFAIGIPSSQQMGTPLVHLSSLSAIGIPSPAAVGLPTLNQETDIVAIGIPSPAAMGLGSVFHAQSIVGIGIPSPAALGTPMVSGGPQRITAHGIESKAAVGMPSLSPASVGVQVFVGGVDVTKYISLQGTANTGLDSTGTANPLQMTSQTIGRWTAVFDFYDPAQTAYPEVDQTFFCARKRRAQNGGRALLGAGGPLRGRRAPAMLPLHGAGLVRHPRPENRERHVSSGHGYRFDLPQYLAKRAL